MGYLLKRSALIVGAAAFTLLAQTNARIDALGGATIVDDINGIIFGSPADVNDYGDVVQGTGVNAATFGPVFGIKSFGDMLTLGAYGNAGGVMQSAFHTDANSFFIIAQLPEIDPVSAVAFPHLLFGIDLDIISIGADVFVEFSTAKDVDEIVTTQTRKATSYNIGALISANIDLETIIISPLFGAGLPRISGENDAAAVDFGSEKGYFLTGGVEVTLPFGDLDLLAGGFVNLETYQFKATSGATSIAGDENSNQFYNFYAGFVADVLTDVLLVGQYSLDIGIQRDITEIATVSTDTDKIVTFTHSFRTGMEKEVEDIWIFDMLTGRAGFNFLVTDTSDADITEPIGGDKQEDITKSPASIKQFTPTLGLALSKGKFQFDLVTQLGNWTGVVSGPPVAKGTITFNFGTSSPSSSSSPFGSSTYTPTPQTRTEPEPSSTESESGSSDDFGGFDF